MVRDEALAPGLALGWGTSNWPLARVVALHACCAALDVPPPVLDSPQVRGVCECAHRCEREIRNPRL